ncbi:hypothetical protein MCEREM30_03071 [Paracoccaceae bacterium]
MFYKKGWKPLSEITREIHDLLDEKYRANPSEWQAEGEAYRMHLLHFSTCDSVYWLLSEAEVGCMTPSGVVSVSSQLLEPVNSGDWENDHVNLTVGTIGSGRWSETCAGEPRVPEEDLRRRFGPFLFSPIVIKEADYKKFMTESAARAEAMASTPEAKGRLRAKQIAQELIKLFDAGQFETRSAARKIIGQRCLSENQFSLGWEQARRERPSIAKPGRRLLR